MESTNAQPRGNGCEWNPPPQHRRYGNAAKRLPDGFGTRSNAAYPPGKRRRFTPGRTDEDEVKPHPAAIALAVEEMREDLPRIGVEGLYLQFRCRGRRWALVTREDVRAALAGIESEARREFIPPGDAGPPQAPMTRTPHGFWSQFQEAVAELHDRGADGETIVRALGDRGWQRVGRDDVTAALRRLRTSNTPWHFLPGRPLPAPRQAAPGLCPSCDFPVTDLGLCRCS